MPDSPAERLQTALGAAYIIERELDGGGMSRVFLAEETRFHRHVVIKLLSPELAAELSVERFEREIALAAGLQQANIVPVLSAGDADGMPWYAMPYVDGESLRARLEHHPIEAPEATAILRDVARALAYAHRHGIVHRDIKPENVLLSGGTAVVTDFGIAKAVSASKARAPGGTLTRIGSSIGTPAYMAPEQAAGDPTTDHRADLYAWGIMAYELFAGRHPFAGRTSPQQLMAAHFGETPALLSASQTNGRPELASIVQQCVAKDPAKRPVSAEAIVDALGSAHSEARGRRRLSFVIGSVALAALVVATILALSARRATPTGTTSSDDAGGTIPTVAVLPMANSGGDARDEYFSDGLTDELAHALTRLPSLRVAGRASSFSFKGKNIPVREIGRQLDVAAVVEGSVRRAGDRVRLNASLTSTRDEKILWSAEYESASGDVFAVQDSFTKAIVGAIAPTLRGATRRVEANRGTSSREAYDAYLKGRYFWSRRGAQNLRTAVDYLRRAVELDPGFARAHATLALTYVTLPGYTPDPADSMASLAKASARRALSLDSTIADGHLALAHALRHDWQAGDAEREYLAAIAYEPGNATAHQWHGISLSTFGQVPAAVEELQRASELDPLSAVIHDNLGIALYAARRFAESELSYRRSLELDPSLVSSHVRMAASLLFSGQPERATRELEIAYRQLPDRPGLRGWRVMALAGASRWDDAERARVEIPHGGAGSAGEMDRAIADLAFGNRAPLLGFLAAPHGRREWATIMNVLGCDPLLDPLQTEPRFIAIMKEVGARTCPTTTAWPVRPRRES